MESSSRTLVCSVLFLDIIEYSKKPVAEQLQLKQAFNRSLATALEQVPQRDRIILDTGDGAAVTFMGDPEDALFSALTVRNMAAEVPVRLGVNLGRVKDIDVRTINELFLLTQPAHLQKMRSLWSIMRMWMEWTYAWQRWPEFHRAEG